MYVREVGPPMTWSEPFQERLKHPIESLRSEELLQIATCKEEARAILEKTGLATLINIGYEEMTKLFPFKRAAILVCAFELARRGLQKGIGVLPAISCPEDTLPFLLSIRKENKEHFICLYMNARNQVIHQETISIGSLSASIVHPREIFAVAIQHSAASIILAHNHPSDDVSPSKDDIELTRRLVKAGEIMGLEILDHIVISRSDFMSLKERGVM